MFDFDGPGHGTTLAHISMLIKEDMLQTLDELAERLAEERYMGKKECLTVLEELEQKGKLGYFSEDGKMCWIPWKPWRG